MTDLEARAEQLVEAMARAIEQADRGPVESYPQRAQQLARAALNVVRTEREQVPCATCEGHKWVNVEQEENGFFSGHRCSTCDGSGSVPGELLVVGLLDSQETQ